MGFFILEGNESEIKNFHDYRTMITDELYDFKNNERPFEFVNKLVDRKIHNLNKFESDQNNSSLDSFDKNPKIIMNPIYENFKFNPLHVKKFKVTRILPEGVQIGLLCIDNCQMEFIPLSNDYKRKSIRLNLSRIQGIVEYRYLFQNRALNIFLYKSQRSKIFHFSTLNEYQTVYNFLKSNSPNLDKTFCDIPYHTNLWVNGLLSNYDYLIFLNMMGSRSFSDLSQYPIMPWIISNYDGHEGHEDVLEITDIKNFRDLTRPIGALNPEKLEVFKEKLMEIKLDSDNNDIPYLYGTFYSIPAHVSYFLVRQNPLFALRLQDGSFGPPNRLFNSISVLWRNAYGVTTDTKELIPEYSFNLIYSIIIF